MNMYDKNIRSTVLYKDYFSENSHLSFKYRNNEHIQVSDTRDLPNVF